MSSRSEPRLLALMLSCCLAACLSGQGQSRGPQVFSFAAIADAQYADAPDQGVRRYRLSPQKLQASVDHLNTLHLAYAIHLGDFIDTDFESFDVMVPIYRQLSVPGYHVLGNHDFWVADERKHAVPSTLGMPSRYYDFEVMGWRFVVLDGNDLSFHAHAAVSSQYQETENYYEQRGLTSPRWNGAIGQRQLAWLREVLKKADRAGETVVLFCHFPVYPEDEVHNLWNAADVIELLESCDCVEVYISGHNHAGSYGVKDGIHYLTLKGMVDTEETSYAVIQVFDDRLEVTGYGREENRILSLR